MKIKILFLSLFLCSVCAISFSQAGEKSLSNTERIDSTGLLKNLTSDNASDNLTRVFSDRAGYMVAKPMTIGAEISGPFYYPDYQWIGSYGVSLAIYTGNSYPSDKRIPGYSELSPLYHSFNDKPKEYNGSENFMYFAPGISLYSKSRKFSFDLYRQFASQPIITGKQKTVPFKANFHF